MPVNVSLYVVVDKLYVVAGQRSAQRLLPVLFGFLIHPRARLLVQERGGFAIESYQR